MDGSPLSMSSRVDSLRSAFLQQNATLRPAALSHNPRAPQECGSTSDWRLNDGAPVLLVPAVP